MQTPHGIHVGFGARDVRVEQGLRGEGHHGLGARGVRGTVRAWSKGCETDRAVARGECRGNSSYIII